MSDLSRLNERGVREQLAAVRECRAPLMVRIQDAERQAALQESAANSLRKISGFLDTYEALLRAELARFEGGG